MSETIPYTITYISCFIQTHACYFCQLWNPNSIIWSMQASYEGPTDFHQTMPFCYFNHMLVIHAYHQLTLHSFLIYMSFASITRPNTSIFEIYYINPLNHTGTYTYNNNIWTYSIWETNKNKMWGLETVWSQWANHITWSAPIAEHLYYVEEGKYTPLLLIAYILVVWASSLYVSASACSFPVLLALGKGALQKVAGRLSIFNFFLQSNWIIYIVLSIIMVVHPQPHFAVCTLQSLHASFDILIYY